MANENIQVNEGAVVNNVNQESEVKAMVETEKKGLIAKFNGLKTWQKVLIVGTAATAVVVGGKVIYDLVKTKPEVVADVAEAVAQNPEVVADAVGVTPTV